MVIVFIHFGLAILLQIISSKIGPRFSTIGYTEIGVSEKLSADAGFNLFYRILTPVIFIMLASTILQYFGLYAVLTNIYHVVIYYVVYRWLLIFIFNKHRLLKWPLELMTSALSVFLVYVADRKLISQASNLLPDVGSLKNEIWLLIILYFYVLLREKSVSINKHPLQYNIKRYRKFEKKYGLIINDMVSDDNRLRLLIYAIMIYEDFNRPVIARYFENICKLFKKDMTLGIMQVRTNKLISDRASINIALPIIIQSYKKILQKVENDNDWRIIQSTASEYNPGSQYSCAIYSIYQTLMDTVSPPNR